MAIEHYPWLVVDTYENRNNGEHGYWLDFLWRRVTLWLCWRDQRFLPLRSRVSVDLRWRG